MRAPARDPRTEREQALGVYFSSSSLPRFWAWWYPSVNAASLKWSILCSYNLEAGSNHITVFRPCTDVAILLLLASSKILAYGNLSSSPLKRTLELQLSIFTEQPSGEKTGLKQKQRIFHKRRNHSNTGRNKQSHDTVSPIPKGWWLTNDRIIKIEEILPKEWGIWATHQTFQPGCPVPGR